MGLVLDQLFGGLLGLALAPKPPRRAQKGALCRLKVVKTIDFHSIFGMSPLLLLSGFLVLSWGPLGANLAPKGRLWDPKKVPK